ncbi:MAG: exosortase family protein XrtG [Lachnospiraceae bacterium]|nr:exosortase family protein XrtG [Lachnospiraceae bacterium]
MYILLGVIFFILWIFVLITLHKAKLQAWFELVGSVGLFIFGMVYIRPVAVGPLSRAVAALAGIVGRVTSTFQTFFRYGIIFIQTRNEGSLTLQIDFECSGIIEILAYLSLLVFYKVYDAFERIVLSVLGVFYIILANAIRIVLICEIIYFGGTRSYYIAHTYVGRIFFYFVTVVMYFYVFTKSQVVRMKVGNFRYNIGGKKKASEGEEEKDSEGRIKADKSWGDDVKSEEIAAFKEETESIKEISERKE